jgi:hypothetical protein
MLCEINHYICSMKNIKIKHESEVYDSSRLYTLTEYGKLKGMDPTKVRYHIFTGRVKGLQINGVLLAILED